MSLAVTNRDCPLDREEKIGIKTYIYRVKIYIFMPNKTIKTHNSGITVCVSTMHVIFLYYLHIQSIFQDKLQSDVERIKTSWQCLVSRSPSQ